MKRLANILAAVAFASPAVLAFDMQTDSTDLKLYDLQVTVDESARKVRVKIDMNMKDYSVGSEREIVYTPVLLACDGSDSLALQPITIAGRTRWYTYLRNGFLDGGDAHIYRAGTKARAHYDEEFAFEPWMGASNLEMRAETANCCDKPERLQGPSPAGNIPVADIRTGRPQLDVDFIFAPPVDAGPVVKSLQGSAFVTFVVNRTELKPTYMNNTAELNKIIRSIDYVRNDTDATITRVHIKGYASPEGPYGNNVRLATGRTETLRQYVRDLYSFPDTTITSSFEPEDWAGLRSYVKDSMNFDIKHRAEILDIIDGPLDPDSKDHALKREYPADYAVILKQIYPWLRHSDYTVTYSIKTYTTLDEIRRVYAADPTRLRNVDFYTLAQSYPEGSDEYCDVFETAVEVYPDDPMINLNAANIEMRRGQFDAAQTHLLKAGSTPQASYARGILAAKRGDYTEATKRFGIARDGGIDAAGEAIKRVNAILDHRSVTLRIKPQ